MVKNAPDNKTQSTEFERGWRKKSISLNKQFQKILHLEFVETSTFHPKMKFWFVVILTGVMTSYWKAINKIPLAMINARHCPKASYHIFFYFYATWKKGQIQFLVSPSVQMFVCNSSSYLWALLASAEFWPMTIKHCRHFVHAQ